MFLFFKNIVFLELPTFTGTTEEFFLAGPSISFRELNLVSVIFVIRRGLLIGVKDYLALMRELSA